MTLQRIAGVCLSIGIASIATAGQPPAAASGAPGTPGNVVRTVEIPAMEQRWAPFQEEISTQAARDVFGSDLNGRRVLRARTESGITWLPDLEGRLVLSSRRIESTQTGASSDLRNSVATVLLRDANVLLREAQRFESTDRRDVVESFLDVNGDWRFTSTRTVVSSGPVEEETLLRPDLNQRLVPAERTIARRSGSNGRDETVVETFAPSAWVTAGYDARLALSNRIRTSTMETAGGRTTIEEVEAPNPAAPGDPMRVTRRTVITVRSDGADRWVSEREVFERDVDGRMVTVLKESGHGPR